MVDVLFLIGVVCKIGIFGQVNGIQVFSGIDFLFIYNLIFSFLWFVVRQLLLNEVVVFLNCIFRLLEVRFLQISEQLMVFIKFLLFSWCVCRLLLKFMWMVLLLLILYIFFMIMLVMFIVRDDQVIGLVSNKVISRVKCELVIIKFEVDQCLLCFGYQWCRGMFWCEIIKKCVVI